MPINPEQTKNEEDKKLLSGVGVARVVSSLTSLGFGVAKTVLSALSGDVAGVAENVATASMVVANASGLSFAVNKIRAKINKSKFAKSEIGKAVIGASGFLWDVATSRPVKLGLRIAGIALVAASTTTPVGWGLLGLATAYTSYKIVTGCLSEGKTKRLEHEAVELQNRIPATSPATIKATQANPVLSQFLSDKLNPVNLDKSKTQKGFGAAVVKTLVGNTIETTGLILEAIESGHSLAVAASGVSVLGNVSEEAQEAIEHKEKQTGYLREIEESKHKIVIAQLLQEPEMLACKDPEVLKRRFQEIYNKEFPPKKTSERISNFFGDIGRGAGRFFTRGLPKLLFSKLQEYERTQAQYNISAPLSPKPERERDVTRQISEEIKNTADKSRKALEADGRSTFTDITTLPNASLSLGTSTSRTRARARLTSTLPLIKAKERGRANTL